MTAADAMGITAGVFAIVAVVFGVPAYAESGMGGPRWPQVVAIVACCLAVVCGVAAPWLEVTS